MKIRLTDRLGRPLASEEGEGSVTLTYNQAYGFEDIWIFETSPGAFVEIELDPYLKPSIIYVPDGKVVYQIPAGPKLQAYHPEAFKGERHQATMRLVEDEVLKMPRNLAMNGLDKRWDTGYFPHASANVVTRDEPWFEAKNAIDGHLTRDGHGGWPYQSWGGGLRDDLEFTLDFGREVLVDEIVIYLRADYNNDHDVNWESCLMTFSDGSERTIKMEKSEEGQSYQFDQKKISWLKLSALKREVSEAFSALSQIEVFGVEA